MRYNITQGLNILFITATIFFASAYYSVAQNVQDSSLHVIKTLEEYQQTIKTDPNKRMINIEKFIPDIDLDLRYATENNFMHRVMYPEKPTFTFLRLPAAKALFQVQKELNKKGLALKIFDAYRPYFVTEKFWELVHDDRYVADPKKAAVIIAELRLISRSLILKQKQN